MNNVQNDGIVRFVNTFTVSEWENKKTVDRNPRKGITRVTKSTSQSIQKLQQTMKPTISIYRPNDENKNQINSHRHYQAPQIAVNYSVNSLLDQIKRLQSELAVMRGEKEQLQRQLKQNKKEGLDGLIESHYITCKDDLDQLIKEKFQLVQKSNILQEENHFLKMNLGIQEQYIIKIQAEVNELRERHFKQVISGCNKESQTESQQKMVNNYGMQTQQNINIESRTIQRLTNCDYQTQYIFKEQPILSHHEVQYKSHYQLDFARGEVQHQYSSRTSRCSFGTQSENVDNIDKIDNIKNVDNIDNIEKQIQMQKLRKIAKQFQDQTYQFTYVIQKLQKEKRDLLLTIQKHESQKSYLQDNNSKLMGQIDQMGREILNKQNIIQAKHKQAKLQVTTQVSSLQQDRDKLILKINDKNQQIQQIQRQLSAANILVERKEAVITRLQNQLLTKTMNLKQQEYHLHAEYRSYKQQLDYLLDYLEKQNLKLLQKEQFIDKKYESHDAIHLKNEETLKNQIDIEAIVFHYQDRIKNIQSSFEQCVLELQEHRRNQREVNYKLHKRSKANQMTVQDQQKVFLRGTIDDLNLKIANITAEHSQINNGQIRLQQKIVQKQTIISKLREEVLNLSKQYQSQACLCSKIKQQNLSLYEAADNLTHMKDEILLQMQTLTSRYQNQISELQCQIYHIQSDLKMQIQKNIASQQSYDLRIQEIKKDYDLLYTKYMKYKNVAKFLQNKANVIL